MWWSTLGKLGNCSPPSRRWVATALRAADDCGAFFGCLHYAAMRPAEEVGLRCSDCTLPASGWGRIELAWISALPSDDADHTSQSGARGSLDLWVVRHRPTGKCA